MTDAEIIKMTKTDLELSYSATSQLGSDIDDLLEMMEASAKEQLNIMGITLSINNRGDCDLVRMFTAYLYRHRYDGDPMPRMLESAIHNRLIQEKAGAENV